MNQPALAPDAMDALLERWRAAWPQALAVWSKFTRLTDARLCASRIEAEREGLSGSFAAIFLHDQRVVIDMHAIVHLDLQDYAVEILAHEIGHHVLAPGSGIDQIRLMARIRPALPTIERFAPMVANLYTDLIINDRLQRQSALRMDHIYRQMARTSAAKTQASNVWLLYLRIYENLWRLDKGALGSEGGKEGTDSDAWLGARLIRVYAKDWMAGAGRFATLLLPYLVDDVGMGRAMEYFFDTRDAAQGCDPSGVLEAEPDETEGIVHPVDDARITGLETDGEVDTSEERAPRSGGGQTREPFQLGEILAAAGLKLSLHDMAVRYYRERALPHLVKFPVKTKPQSPEPQLEALEPWALGDPLDEIDWLQSVLHCPRPIPGMTTLRRTYGTEPARDAEKAPVDLDMYVDSSGSMPNPQERISYLALAGAIIALSALRAGSRVQVTLWSGKNQLKHTDGFVRDSDAILRVLTGFFGGGTCFPIHQLRQTFCGPTVRTRPAHILHISDDGITTMFAQDELGNSGRDIAARALAAGGAGGTMALNLPANWDSGTGRHWGNVTEDLRFARKQGWDIHAIEDMAGLVEFARSFSRRHYTSG
ncbi:MAG: VWA domain-containing protein [Massilia sp.]